MGKAFQITLQSVYFLNCTLPTVLLRVVPDVEITIDDFQIYNSLYSITEPTATNRIFTFDSPRSVQIMNLHW